MQIYLPIAELSVNIFVIISLGGLTGILSGLFGIGGGFLTTPLLIFLGVPPSISVATSANQIIAASVSGFLTHWKKNNVDFRMGFLLLVGGLIGSTMGVNFFKLLKKYGQIDLVISVAYVVFLSAIGLLMAAESTKSKWQKTPAPAKSKHTKIRDLINLLPLKIKFPRSKLYISVLLPIGIGVGIGIMVSLMGIGGGFLLIPAMIYLLGMPSSVVIGTSLFQIIFTTANVTFLHAVTTQTVDIVLAFFLLIGAVIGVHYGGKLGAQLSPEKLRRMLSAVILTMALCLAYGLFVTPQDIYTVTKHD